MTEKIESTLKDLMSALQVAKIYTTEHPKFSEAIEKAHVSLQEVFTQRQDIVVGIVGEAGVGKSRLLLEAHRLMRNL